MATLPAPLEAIDEKFGPHLSATVAAGANAGAIPDRVVQTHCCFCGQQCGIKLLVKDEQVCAYPFDGVRYDCGSKIGFLEATLAFALRHPQLGAEFQQLVNRAADGAEPGTLVAGQGGRGARHLTLVSS